MDNQKRNRLLGLLIVALCIALVFAFLKIDALETEIQQVRNHYMNELQMIRNDVSRIYSDVDRMLEEKASLLSGVESSHGAVNLNDQTIDVTVTVVPKVISQDMKLFVSLEDEQAELVSSGSGYTGTIPVDLFSDGGRMLLTIEADGVVQTQYLDEVQVDYLWQDYIPTLYACDISGSSTYDAHGRFHLKGDLNINYDPVGDVFYGFEKFLLITELNGEEIKREDITKAVLDYQIYPHGLYYQGDYQAEYTLEYGDLLTIHLEATDYLGYTHRMLMYYWEQESGQSAFPMDASEYIYDPNGVQVCP